MIKILSIISIILLSPSVWAQEFAFYKNSDELFISSVKGKITSLGKGDKFKKDDIYYASRYFSYSSMPKDILNSIPLSDGMGISSVQQLTDNKTWLFIERNMETNAYDAGLYDSEKKLKTIIVSQDNSPGTNYAFRPIAWVKEKGIVYLEAMMFGSAEENEGIWSYNLDSKQFSKLPISPSYLTTPHISPDGNYFIYSAASGTKGLHSESRKIYLYNIEKNKEALIQKDNQSLYSIIGWIKDSFNRPN